MKSAELKKEKSVKLSNNTNNNGRVRHCYPRQEVYHRFIHDDTYVYHSKNNPVWGKFNYLFVSGFHNYAVGKKETKEDIETYWYARQNSCLAVIDRETKRIIIRRNFEKHSFDLVRAVPDDWEIFYTDETIPSANILQDKETLYKYYAKYLIHNFVVCHLSYLYSAIDNNKSNIVHSSIEALYNYNYYNRICNLVKKYKLNKYSWYNESIGSASVRFDRNSYKQTSIPYPTLKQIINKTIFNKKETTIINQKAFYTKYCYGNGISFKDTVDNWNKTYTKEEIVEKFNKYNISVNKSWFEDSDTWNNHVSKVVTIEKDSAKNYIKENLQKSEQNYRDALNQVEGNLSVGQWRSGQYSAMLKSSTYLRFIPNYRYPYSSKWETARIYGSYNRGFSNVQLKLTHNRMLIVTSRGASVTIAEGIKMFKLFITARLRYSDSTLFTSLEFNNPKVGIYNFRFIKYTDKVTDNGVKLGYKDWLIQIGCHAIWLNEIINFIEYYDLEEEFGLNKYPEIAKEYYERNNKRIL